MIYHVGCAKNPACTPSANCKDGVLNGYIGVIMYFFPLSFLSPITISIHRIANSKDGVQGVMVYHLFKQAGLSQKT